MDSCYYANGQKVNYVPCNHTAVQLGEHSSCCAVGDGCLANGLCKTKYGSGWAHSNYYWREACTDRTFLDPACANYCHFNYKESQLVWQCREPESWRCNTGTPPKAEDRAYTTNYTCCDIEELKFGAEDGGIWTTAAAVTIPLPTGPRSNSISTPTTSTSEPTTAPKSSFDSSNNKLAIGLGVGLGFAILALVGITGFFVWRRRSRKNGDPAPEYKPYVAFSGNNTVAPGSQVYRHEAEGNGLPAEIGRNNQTLELEGESLSL